MQTIMSIGDFARATHLSVKALRFYHQEGLLAPAEVDPASGYRRYDVVQIPEAQVIRRLRDLEMPLDEIRGVMHTTDPVARAELIGGHLQRLERRLDRVQGAVASLRDLLERPVSGIPVEHRRVPALQVAAVSEVVSIDQIGRWYNGALGELYATTSAQDCAPSGHAGGIYEDSLFSSERGEATVYLPIDTPFEATGRVHALEVPMADLAVISHDGSHDGIDRAYGALAEHVTRHALALDGPIREFYPVNRHHTADSTRWRTQIGWPIFGTASL